MQKLQSKDYKGNKRVIKHVLEGTSTGMYLLETNGSDALELVSVYQIEEIKLEGKMSND